MCMMIYLAADEPLRLVPWVESAPAFNTSLLAAEEARVGGQFGKPHVVYAGSYEGCGCGFQLKPDACAYLDSEALHCRELSLRAFAAYLGEEVVRVGPVSLFACWDGDQEAHPEHRRELTPSALEAQNFFFLENELSTVVPDAG